MGKQKEEKKRKTDTGILEGTYLASKTRSGFVTVEGEPEDFYIPRHLNKGAMHLDTVRIIPRKKDSGRRQEAEIVAVLERATESTVGTFGFSEKKQLFFIQPDDRRFRRIEIPADKRNGVREGQKAMVRIFDYGDGGEAYAKGEITEILGDIHTPGVDILAVVKGMKIPTEFPPEVLSEAVDVAKPVSREERKKRLDLRRVTTVTIDGEDSKDLDDAISLEKKGRGYRLGVHIADVSHYVREGGALDKEALNRGTSVYLADRVIPMLPEVLSNGICSLNEGEDRLALSCLMQLDEKGRVTDYRIERTVIRSNRRMTYTAVKKILVDHDPAMIRKYWRLVPLFQRMEELSALLRKNRSRRGSIDFESRESKILCDTEGRPVKIEPYELSVANGIIEDFMLMANETVAKAFSERAVPFLYRVHGRPDPEKIRALAMFLGSFGYTLPVPPAGVKPKEIQKMLTHFSGAPEEPIVTRLTLRSMQQARYSVEDAGHFGIAARHYCHFTSPIRRYPDLQIHRIIKEVLSGELDQKRQAHYASLLPLVAARTSSLERRADEAERDVEKMKKAEYMEKRIGKEYDAVISGVTAWGFYAELPSSVEGLVPVGTLTDDFYLFDETKLTLFGTHTGRTFHLGETVRIRVEGANKDERTVDFSVVGMPGKRKEKKALPKAKKEPRPKEQTGHGKRGKKAHRKQ